MRTDDVKVLVDELYQFRDHFFENYPIEQANERPRMLEDKLKECIKAIDKLEIQSQSTLYSQPDESGDGVIKPPAFHSISKPLGESSSEHLSDDSIKSAVVEVGLNNCSLNHQSPDNRDQDIQRINYSIDNYSSQDSIHEKAR